LRHVSTFWRAMGSFIGFDRRNRQDQSPARRNRAPLTSLFYRSSFSTNQTGRIVIGEVIHMPAWDVPDSSQVSLVTVKTTGFDGIRGPRVSLLFKRRYTRTETVIAFYRRIHGLNCLLLSIPTSFEHFQHSRFCEYSRLVHTCFNRPSRVGQAEPCRIEFSLVRGGVHKGIFSRTRPAIPPSRTSNRRSAKCTSGTLNPIGELEANLRAPATLPGLIEKGADS
jgi:hypothetical protein